MKAFEGLWRSFGRPLKAHGLLVNVSGEPFKGILLLLTKGGTGGSGGGGRSWKGLLRIFWKAFKAIGGLLKAPGPS